MNAAASLRWNGRGTRRMASMILPLFIALYQSFAKRLAEDGGGFVPLRSWLERILVSPILPVLVVAEIASFGLWMYILSVMPLSEAFPLTATSYILVLLASWSIFGETGTVLQVMGTAAIMMGIWLLGRTETANPA
ncbi:EamA family transporter [Rhizorhabdus argentea]|uniref:EamA family transporter n=1 Tax=Rhizorhabdus argentea TaxID=1387174 RepID=UPI0030EE6A24